MVSMLQVCVKCEGWGERGGYIVEQARSGEGGGAPRDCGGRDVAPDPFYLRIHSTDDTFLVTDAFRLPTWGTGLAG